MKNAKRGRVPVIEDALGLNLYKLMAARKQAGQNVLSISWGREVGLVSLDDEKLIVMFGGVMASAEIGAVLCLGDRWRPLLKCPRAHEGNFQTLYLYGGVLACRQCHQLRYRSTMAAGRADRARLARSKLLEELGGKPGDPLPVRAPGTWRRRYRRMTNRLAQLSAVHYDDLRRRWGVPEEPARQG